MHRGQAAARAASWGSAYLKSIAGHGSFARPGQCHQRRCLSEVYRRVMEQQQTASKADKDTSKEATKATAEGTEEAEAAPPATPVPKARESQPVFDIGTLASSMLSKSGMKPIQGNPKAVSESYIADLHASVWSSEETWVRFSQLSRKSLGYLRDIDVNCTLARIRGSERSVAKGGQKNASSSAVLDRMLKVYELAKKAGFTPDRYTYQELIAANVSLGNFAYAREWINTMERQGIKPTIRPFRTLLKGYGVATDHIANVRQLWQEIRKRLEQGEIAAETSADGQTVEAGLDVATYTCIVGAEVRAGSFPRVIELLEEMDKAGIKADITVRNVVLEGILRWKGLDAGLEEVELMEQSGFVPNGYTYSLLLNTALRKKEFEHIRALLKAAAAKDVVPPIHILRAASLDPYEVLDIMDGLGDKHKVRLYNVLIEWAVRRNSFVTVQQLIDHMRRNSVPANVVTYTLLLDTMSKAGRLDQAKDMFTRTFQRGKGKGLKPDAHIFSVMIDACGRHGDVGGMFWFKSLMQQHGLAATEPIYNSILSALARWRQSNLQAVMLTVNELERARPQVRPTTRTFNAIFAAFVAQVRSRQKLGEGELEFLRTWYRNATGKYYVSGDSYTYFLATCAFVGARCLEDAMSAYGDMVRQVDQTPIIAAMFAEKPQAVLDLMRLAVDQQEFESVLTVWKSWIPLGLPHMANAVKLVLFACDQMGRPDTACDIIDGLLAPQADSTRFCPQMVDESVLDMYAAILFKHGELKAVVSSVEQWTRPSTAEAAERQLSLSAASKLAALLRHSKYKGAAAVAEQLGALVDGHSDAVSVQHS
ncbi:hypothetical protein GGF46_005419 [Coemansia sp. RSA 552]|nr:hypothetical protein GGF46_005419 [Coemansia sp. RSA 552]